MNTKPNFVVLNHHGEEPIVAMTIQEALECVADVLSEDGEDYNASRMKIYTLGVEIPFIVQPATVSLKSDVIPAPLPGETVGDYARRITATDDFARRSVNLAEDH